MMSETGTIEIREVRGEEIIDAGGAVANYAFGASPSTPDPDAARQRLPYLANARGLVASTDGQPQASLLSYEMSQNLRGAVLPMGGIAAVASMPSGRRRGAVRRLMDRQMELYRAAGVPISALYAFRDSFYERLGYAALPNARHLTFDPQALTPLVRLDKPGSCEMVAMKDGFDEWRAYLERYQRQTHGFALKHVSNARRWQDANEWWVAFARDEAGEIAGAMTYRITGYTGSLIASTFYTTSALGRYQLLDWVGRHADQVKEAVIELRPDDLPELWYRDLRSSVRTDVEHAWIGAMARVVDVAGLTGIGAGDGEVTVAIQDRSCPWNEGAFTFRGEGGTLTVTPGGEPSASITIQGLSGLVFCGTDPATFPFLGWGAPDPKTAEALRTLFPPVVPDIHETF